MVQHIGKSQYGLFTLANSLITLFLIDFGLSAATARFVSKYNAEGNQQKVNCFLGAVYKLYLLVSAVIMVILIVIYFFIDSIYVKLTPSELKQFKVIYIIAATYSVINFPFVTLNGIMTAYEKFIQLKIADLIYRFLNIGLVVFALLKGYGLYALVTVNAISGLIVLLYKYIIIRTSTPVRVSFQKNDKSLYKEIFGFSLWTTVNALAQRMIFNITPSILGIVANSNSIAIFGIVTTIEGYTYTITTAINGMFMPKISRIYAKSDNSSDIMPLMIRVGRFQFALNGLIIVGFTIIGKKFVELWMGKEFLGAYIGILLVIIPGAFFNSIQIANTAMIVRNKVKLQAYVAVLCGVLNVLFSFPLSKAFGAIGAAFSIFISYSIRAILYHIICKKVMEIDIILFIKKCYLKMFPPILITFIFGILINIFIKDENWTFLGLEAIILVCIYVISILIFGFTKEEHEYFLRKLKNKLSKIGES